MRSTTFFSIILLMLVTMSVSAHHSKTAHFDTSRTVAITGEVVMWRFRSPHSTLLLNVREEDGSVHQWTIECSAAPTLRRQGMDRKTLVPGEIVDVRAEPSRNPDARVAFGLTFRTADGSTYGERKKLEKVAQLSSDVKGIQRLAGRWEGLGLGELRDFKISVNAAGQEAIDNYEDATSPANTCEPVNLPTILHVPNFLFDVRIEDNQAIIKNEIYEVTRRVPLGTEFKQAEPTGRFGLIRGSIEGDVLVVESNEYLPSKWGIGVAAFQGGADIPSSTQKRVTERYISRDEGQSLRVEYTIEDPVYLSEPYKGYRDFGRVSDDSPMYPYECDTDSASRFSREQ